MLNKISSIITKPHNYEQLLEEVRSTLVEHEFISRWTLIEGYHAVGKKLDKETRLTVTQIARDVGKSSRTIYRCVQFYRKYPNLELLPEGKNVSWHKIVNKYLPESTKGTEEKKNVCPKCGYEIK